MPQEYSSEIIENAKSFGFKAANLMFLENCIAEFKEANPSEIIDATIPAILPVASEQIMDHLRAHIPYFDSKWAEFCSIQKESQSITPEAKEILLALQEKITKCFIDHPLNIEDLPNSPKLMVRSSGEEDRVDVANPGGNESVASEPKNISESIGTVIASYISEKSLLQRLKSGEDITKHFPLSPCLIQTMVEGKSNKPAVSGVIYTDNGHVRIQSALGHGELIVNSKGNFDNYYITPANKVYVEIRDKQIRLTPKMNKQTSKMEQVVENNNFEQATDPSLDEQTAIYLHNLANFIEQKPQYTT